MKQIDQKCRLYWRLMRLNKPTGIWLLLWPCFWSVALASDHWSSINILLLFAAGAAVMRSAGCVINDIVDRDIDAQVARTRDRPIASGAVRRLEAVGLTIVLLLIGLVILLQLHPNLLYWSPIALILVFTYPFMKRITWWPQAFLGLTFNLGVLFGWIAVQGTLDLPAIVLYLAAICWTIGYDTIYAHQDMDDDLRISVKSTAIRFGNNSRSMIAGFYTVFVVLLLGVGITAAAGPIYYTGVALTAAHLSWQVVTVQLEDSSSCLTRFRSNSWLGFILFSGILLDHAMH
jgi:4-hydroxybenzoate polyprenyltransferase